MSDLFEKWEEVSCNNCGCPHERLIDLKEKLKREDGWRFVECPDCRLRFYSPRPAQTAQWMEVLFFNKASRLQSELLLANGSFWEVADKPAQIEFLKNHYAGWAKKMAAYLGREPSAIYEMGCSVGWMLGVLRSLYPKATIRGCDPVPYMTGICRRVHGHTVETGLFQDVALEEESQDIIIGWNVIEHTFTPREDIAKAIRCLRPGGVLYLRTFYEEGNGDKKYTDPLGHQYHYFKDVLEGIMAKQGLATVHSFDADGVTMHIMGKKD